MTLLQPFDSGRGIRLEHRVLLRQAVKEQVKMEMEHEKDLSLLESFANSKDLNGLEKAADNIEKKWSQREEEYYFALMLKICDLLNSTDFNDYGRQTSLIQKYATLILNQSETIPLEIELPLLLHLQEDIDYSKGVVKGVEWSKQRSRIAKSCFGAWQRLENELDKKFDFNDLPERNVAPPLGTNLPSGIAPEDVEDPKLRAEYEATLAKNKQKAQNYNRQLKLREMDKLFSPKAEQYIISAYSKPPFELEELKQYFEEYVADKERSARILDAVKREMKD